MSMTTITMTLTRRRPTPTPELDTGPQVGQSRPLDAQVIWHSGSFHCCGIDVDDYDDNSHDGDDIDDNQLGSKTYENIDQGRLLVTAGDPVEKVEVGGRDYHLYSLASSSDMTMTTRW